MNVFKRELPLQFILSPTIHFPLSYILTSQLPYLLTCLPLAFLSYGDQDSSADLPHGFS